VSDPAPSCPAVPAPSNRRDLLLRALDAGLLLGGAGLVVAATVGAVRFVLPPPPRGAARVVQVRTANTVLTGSPDGLFAVRFLFRDQPAIVIRRSRDEVAAFVAMCTHLQCIVHYDAATSRLVCPCHEAAFDLTGRPISGPPTRPLARLRVVKHDPDYVWVTDPAP
jgi:cytochrome b6-f complex iron-sulfur subunit